MRTKILFILSVLLSGQIYCQDAVKPARAGQIKFITTGQVLLDLQQHGTASKYYETSKDLIYLDENLIGALNAITPGQVTP